MSLYIVWSPQGVTPPKVTFTRRWAAERAAQQLAQRHQKQDFYVMKAKSLSATQSDREIVESCLRGRNDGYIDIMLDSLARRIVDNLAAPRQVITRYFGKWRPNMPGADKA